MLFQRSFRSMGTGVQVQIVYGPGMQDAVTSLGESVESLFREEHDRFTRFESDSELSRLNAEGRLERPSAEMREVLEHSLHWHRATSRLFNPAILPALVAAGYDRTFDEIEFTDARASSLDRAAAPNFAAVCRVDPAPGGPVELSQNAQVDLGGIVKGWTVDRAARLLSTASGYLIDAGGDIRVGGRAPEPCGWGIAIEDPFQRRYCADLIVLTDRGVATSSTRRRAWTTGGRREHHLIDPRTGEPSRTDTVSATVVTDTVEKAEVYSKTAVLLGSVASLAWLSDRGDADAFLILENGESVETEGWRRWRPYQRTAVSAAR